MILYDNHFVDSVVYNGNQVNVVNCNGEQIFPERALIFVSDNPFTVGNNNNMTGFCDGALEVRSGNGNWTSWDGSTTITASIISNKYIVSFRGTGNTYFYKSSSVYLNFVLTGSNIELKGSPNYLLDYTREITSLPTPSISNVGTFDNMFKDCTGLTSIPTGFLPATTLVSYCYRHMFKGCTGLTNVPNLPATTLANNCYMQMFYNCTGLTTLPANLLPVATLATYCYREMFSNCTSLRLSNTQSPIYNKKVVQFGAISPATAVYEMFQNVPNVTATPTNNLAYYSK